MGLSLLSIDGLAIKKVKTWMLKCHACNKYVCLPTWVVVIVLHLSQSLHMNILSLSQSHLIGPFYIYIYIYIYICIYISISVSISLSQYRVNKDMSKKFCSACGLDTLRRIAVSIDESGEIIHHINPKMRISLRGTKVLHHDHLLFLPLSFSLSLFLYLFLYLFLLFLLFASPLILCILF